MAFVLEDRVVETANNPGQGDFELLGARENNQTFVAGIGNGNTTRYLAIGAEGAEIGVAQVQAGSPDRLLRPGTVKNFDGTTTPVNFAGTVTVACIASVEDVLWLGENGDLPARAGRDLGTAGSPWRDGRFSRAVYAAVLHLTSGNSIALLDDNGQLRILGGTHNNLNSANIMLRGENAPQGPEGFLASGGVALLRWNSQEVILHRDVVFEGQISGVVESGSNANGNYTKFFDGTMICEARVSVDLLNGGTEDFSMPAHFSQLPAPGIGTSRGSWTFPGGDLGPLRGLIVGGSTTNWWVNNPGGGSSSSFGVHLSAVGRWK